jgi:endonuclease/exonuclease/phosphatase family metal-dependent hydrolase
MSTPTFRAVSYNMLTYGRSAMRTRAGQLEMLRFLRPDAVCLQEIYAADADLAELDRLVTSIADGLRMTALAVPARHSDCHLAILWRPEYHVLSSKTYDLLMWHGLGVVRLDIGADVPLTVAVTHLAPWNPDKRLSDTITLTGQLPLTDATIIGAEWNSFGADPGYDPDPDWAAPAPQWVERQVPWNDDPHAPPIADRRPAQMMQRSGFFDAAPTLGAAWQATGGQRGGWRRREDVFWTTRPAALRKNHAVDIEQAKGLSDHLPIVVDLDPKALTEVPSFARGDQGVRAGQVTS